MKKVIRMIFLSFLAVFLLFSCSKKSSTGTDDVTLSEGQKWWEKFGEPKYGGKVVIRAASIDMVSLDPAVLMGPQFQFWYEQLFVPSWTIDRNDCPYNTEFVPQEYYSGLIAESWEQKDPQTIVIKIRKGVRWQDKSPVNGREFTSDDVKQHYDRLLGTGSGYTKPNPFFAGMLSNFKEIIANDKYTVTFKLKNSSIFSIYDILCPQFGSGMIEAPEWVKLGHPQIAAGGPPGKKSTGPPANTGPAEGMSDWKNSVGTSPWMLSEYVPGVSLTYGRNSNYWGIDERYPENKLPYLDTVKELAIPDMSTAIAALRTGKIDIIAEGRFGPTWQNASALTKSNPEIKQASWPAPGASIELRADKKPFNDIRVRQALQMSVDRTAIAKSHYGGVIDGKPSGLASPAFKGGWTPSFDEWPDNVKELFSYNKSKAKELLADAGFPGGFKTNCIVANIDDITLMQLIKSEFSDIGVDMEIKTMDMMSFMGFMRSGKNDQMVLTSTTGMALNPAQAILRRTSNQDGENFTHSSDPKYDAIVEKFKKSTSIDRAKELFKEAELYALEQSWAINVCPTSVPVLWHSRLKGYSGEQMQGWIPGYYFAHWWLDEK